VSIEVALEVEVGEVVSVREAEQLLEGSIRLDVMLILEGVLLDVLVDLTGHVGARDEGTLGLTEEGAELISDLGRDLKDGRTTLGALFAFSLYAAAALASILDFTVDTLFKLLDLSDHGGNDFTETREASEHALHVFIKGGGRSLRGSGIRGRSRDNGGSSGYRGRSSGGSDFLGSLLGLSSSRSGYNRSNGGRSSGDRGIVGFLGDTLLGRGRGGGGGIHHISTGGSIHLN
jgi:hypothetical protein